MLRLGLSRLRESCFFNDWYYWMDLLTLSSVAQMLYLPPILSALLSTKHTCGWMQNASDCQGDEYIEHYKVEILSRAKRSKIGAAFERIMVHQWLVNIIVCLVYTILRS